MVWLFIVGLSLLLVHEMDAIRHREWKMLIGLKDLEEKTAYRLFVVIHIPLYCTVLFLLLSPYVAVGYVIIDVFLVVHALVHLLFRKHRENRFNVFSNIIIYAGGACGLVHLAYLLLLYFTII